MDEAVKDWNDAYREGASAIPGADESWKANGKASDKRSGEITAEALQRTNFPPIKYVVPDFVPEGLTILAGKPKMGKSWLALDFSLAVAYGGVVLGEIEVEQGDVLCLALEDNLRRLQSRLTQMLGDRAWPKRLTFRTESPLLDEGGLELIKAWIESADGPRLIIIDTLQRVRKSRSQGQGHYEADYSAVTPLQELAGQHGIAILVVHHLRKQEADDPLDQVSGSTGLTGCADTTLVLMRDSNGVTLYGRGRDIQEIKKAVRFDTATGCWSVVGDADDVRRSEQRKRIIAVLEEEGSAMGPKIIAAATGMKEENVRRLLGKMVTDDEIKKGERGEYTALSA
jgi:predicted ATP-dependent serine protease